MFNNISRQPLYDVDAVQPMRDELVAVGINELLSPAAVEEAILVNDDKTKLVIINSVCGCAAGAARPGVSLALQNSVIPDNLYTVFAGQERDAVEKLRSLITGHAPSSPSMAIFKNGKVEFFLPRYEIEGYSAEQIASRLTAIFNEKCSAQGPSVSREAYEKVVHAKACGSKIELFQG